MFRPRIVLAALVLLSTGPLAAQVTSVDEGSFTIVREGERVGREDFSIRSAPSANGRVLVAQGNSVTGGRRIAPALNADTTGFPSRYQLEVRVDGRVVESVSGQVSRNHYEARTLRADGESAREFRLPSGTVIADDDVLHQLWFIVRRGVGVTVPVLVPRRSVVEMVRVEFAGVERLTIDNREILARHLVLTTQGSGVSRDAWVDTGGRLLKAAIPSLKIVAVRDEAPR